MIPDSLKSRAAASFASIRAEMNNTAGGIRSFFSKFLAGGGAIGIIAAGIASIGKIAMTAYNSWTGRMKEAGEMARRNAASVRETAEANERLRQKTDGYLSQLQGLASQEQLSNANKTEARKLIQDLSRA